MIGDPPRAHDSLTNQTEYTTSSSSSGSVACLPPSTSAAGATPRGAPTAALPPQAVSCAALNRGPLPRTPRSSDGSWGAAGGRRKLWEEALLSSARNENDAFSATAQGLASAAAW
eukprot:CAMPEP_0115312812 /NCGR_PEP_ID=MMETSP0270-20121206/76107_1 /TAXON_ID=71861 /ORGANISM="Scrippsiella trochoidea, Strain CCMP3099" /LENGTH=114 /DNA_ID=CAMNT_0002731813 /DNA_START=24 /DNA_END=366 /DNA_ORIENTATION=+